tara:strand:- start:74437 stop:75312 length:876 start_codon:yes stop_codon:yes gene_type:complete
MKVALCFLINYNNNIVKEEIWKEWITQNKDIIDVFIHYNKELPIKSEWIKMYAIPEKYIEKTSYFHVVPAYMSVLQYAYNKRTDITWFCLLTESCVPIVSPKKFRRIFTNTYNQSILAWRKAWWNVNFHKRANLRYFEENMRLGHDPWFVLKRTDVLRCISYSLTNKRIYNLICQGGLANESLFAIILFQNKKLKDVINQSSHLTDWTNPSSATSPYVFDKGSEKEIALIKTSIENNKYLMFMRKIGNTFPNNKLSVIISENDDNFFDWYFNYSSLLLTLISVFLMLVLLF